MMESISHPAHLTNLPIPPTSFIGRKNETSQVKDQVAKARLVTLAGAGGSGKTRLALHVAEQFSALPDEDVLYFADGVWLVELAALSDAELVPNQVAAAFSLPIQPDQPVLPALIRFLRDKELLLVLDNCEHLIAACAELCDGLLRACPDLKIMATSRTALNIPGEVTFQVPPLRVGDVETTRSLAQLEQYESAQLFITRVKSGQPHLELTDRHAGSIAQICARLDGIPLALELAAARAKALSLEQIVLRLDNMFPLLARGSRVALPRHQTMHAAMEWSYDLLTAAERVLFRRLAVFAGGWSLEAAEFVSNETKGLRAEPVPATQSPVLSTLDLLSNLVDKSIVIAEEQDGAARYRMLEPIRQYALEKLREAGEEHEIRAQHVDFFLRLAEEAEPHMTSAHRPKWLARLKAEHSNLRAALEWAYQHDPHAALRLAGSLGWFWYFGDVYTEGHAWLERVVLLDVAGQRTQEGAKALLSFARIELDFTTSSSPMRLQECVALWREIGDPHYLGHALWVMGYSHYQEGKGTCYELFSEAVELGRQTENQWSLAFFLIYQGVGRFIKDQDAVSAGTLLQEGLTLWRTLRDPFGTALALTQLGRIAKYGGDYDAARLLLTEGLGLRRIANTQFDIAVGLWDLSDIARLQGNLPQARQLANEALALFERVGVPWGVRDVYFRLSSIAAEEDDYLRALDELRHGLQLLQQPSSQRISMEWGFCQSVVIAAALDENVHAAKLMGAWSNFRSWVLEYWTPHDHAEWKRVSASVRSELGAARFEKAFAEGQALTPEQAIAEAIRVTDELAQKVQTVQPVPTEYPAGLTEREVQVLRLLTLGLSNQEIADQLVL